MNDDTNNLISKFEPKAEKYRFRDIYRFKARHPEAPEELFGNTLIIGSAGAGKSMVMRQLCRDYSGSPTVFPLYVHAEQWLARVLAETAKSGGEVSGPALRRTRIYGNALLGLGVIERLSEVLGEDVAWDACRIYPSHPANPSSLRDWLKQTHQQLLQRVKDQVEPPPEFASLDSLTEILEYFGETVKSRSDGKRLLLLVDQLDRVSPAYFSNLTAALGRSMRYTLCIATRPSPCAPFRTVVSGHTGDYDPLWLGKSWATTEWKDFLLDSTKPTFDPRVTDIVAPLIDRLADLVGPSTRDFLSIVRRTSTSVLRGRSLDESVKGAIDDEMRSFQTVLGGALTGFEDSSEFRSHLLSGLETFSDHEVQRWPTALRIAPMANGLLLSEKTEDRLRVAVREGLLIPKEPTAYGIDEPTLEYEVLPLAIMKPSRALRISRASDLVFAVDEADFLAWSKPRWSKRSVADPAIAVFYSHWMSDENPHASRFLSQLRMGLKDVATITTGKEGDGPPVKAGSSMAAYVISDAIRQRIKGSSVVVTQLDPPRLAIGIELGWALSIGRRVVLAVANWADWEPWGTHGGDFGWLKPIEISSNGTQGQVAELIQRVISRIDDATASESLEVFIDDQGTGAAHIGQFHREATSTVVVGSGLHIEQVKREISNRFLNEGLAPPIFVDTEDTSQGGLLAKIVSRARRATSLLVVVSGEQVADYLSFVALGAFSYLDADAIVVPETNGRRRSTLARQVVLLDLSGRPQNYVPLSMVKGLPGLTYTRDSIVAADAIVDVMKSARAKLKPSPRRGAAS